MDFYIVDEVYISYLQDYERKHRNGITRVPNVRYADRNKFSFGAVLIINDISSKSHRLIFLHKFSYPFIYKSLR